MVVVLVIKETTRLRQKEAVEIVTQDLLIRAHHIAHQAVVEEVQVGVQQVEEVEVAGVAAVVAVVEAAAVENNCCFINLNYSLKITK